MMVKIWLHSRTYVVAAVSRVDANRICRPAARLLAGWLGWRGSSLRTVRYLMQMHPSTVAGRPLRSTVRTAATLQHTGRDST
jgi:hypothetical protein